MWISLLAALLSGSVAGASAKFADESGIPGAGMIGTYFGVWIMCVAVIAALSHSWRRAVVCSMTFLLAMIAAYYVSQMLLFGFFSTRLLLAWTAIALFLAPPFAALAWCARGYGWQAALGATLPVGLLLAEAYSLRLRLDVNEDYRIVFVFDVVCAVVLLLVLPRNRAQWVRVLALTPVIMVGARLVLEYALQVVGAFVRDS
jgi:hypothetical protein